MASKPLWVLLPGMDGTGELHDDFRASLPDDQPLHVITYPTDRPWGYEELDAYIDERLPEGDLVVIGESFSSPLAVLLAQRRPEQVKALILVAGFLRCPFPGLLATPSRLLGPLPFLIAPPKLALRLMLLDFKAPRALVQATQSAIAKVSAKTFARRLRAIFEVDVRAAWSSLSLPKLTLHGLHDRLLRPSALQDVEQDSELVKLEAPHLILQCTPSQAAAAITDFLARHGQPHRQP